MRSRLARHRPGPRARARRTSQIRRVWTRLCGSCLRSPRPADGPLHRTEPHHHRHTPHPARARAAYLSTRASSASTTSSLPICWSRPSAVVAQNVSEARPHRRRAPLCPHRREHIPDEAGHRSDHAHRARLRGDRAVIPVAGEALFDLVVSFGGSIEAHPGGAPSTSAARSRASSAKRRSSAHSRMTASARRSRRARLGRRRSERRRERHPSDDDRPSRPRRERGCDLPFLRRRHVSPPRLAKRPQLRPCDWRPPRCTWARWVSSSSRSRPP